MKEDQIEEIKKTLIESLLDLAGLKLELQELLRRRVDVLTYKSLHPLLKERILSEQEVIL